MLYILDVLLTQKIFPLPSLHLIAPSVGSSSDGFWGGVLVEFGGSQGVYDLDNTIISNVDRSRGHQLRIEGVELIWILISPERETLNSANHGKCALKGIDNILPTKSVILSRHTRGDRCPRLDDFEGVVTHGRSVPRPQGKYNHLDNWSKISDFSY